MAGVGLDISHAQQSGDAEAGRITVGGFNFAPKSSTLPTVAWVAIAAVAALLLFKFVKR